MYPIFDFILPPLTVVRAMVRNLLCFQALTSFILSRDYGRFREKADGRTSSFGLVLMVGLIPPSSHRKRADPRMEPQHRTRSRGYKIHYGTQSGIYGSVLDVGNVTQYTVTGLEPQTQYYFSLTAYDTSANESDFSEEVSAVTDPPHRVISGLGGASGGWIEVFAEDYSHAEWLRVGWASYNSANGEARIATGDIDGDGRDEIVVGLGPVWERPYPGGWFQVLDDDYSPLTWGRVGWSSYNSANGETWPACGDVDGDGTDEIIIGLGPYPSGGGWLEVFHYDGSSVAHTAWIRVNWYDYNTANGETRPACGDVDGDGRDEIVVGLGPVSGDPYYPGGWFEVLDDDYNHLAWGRVNWSPYNSTNGETWPAVKK
jgi:hypothetical protein